MSEVWRCLTGGRGAGEAVRHEFGTKNGRSTRVCLLLLSLIRVPPSRLTVTRCSAVSHRLERVYTARPLGQSCQEQARCRRPRRWRGNGGSECARYTDPAAAGGKAESGTGHPLLAFAKRRSEFAFAFRGTAENLFRGD